MPKVGVHIIHGNIEILSEFSKSQGAYYTWGRIIHGNLQYHLQIMETSTFTIFRAILLGGTSSSSSFQADISAKKKCYVFQQSKYANFFFLFISLTQVKGQEAVYTNTR